MAQNSNRALGKTLEMKICPKYAPKSTYKNVGENSGLQHLECSLEKSTTHIGTCFLGKFAMVRVPYSGWIPSRKCHPYD
jgi:hypothetical protein